MLLKGPHLKFNVLLVFFRWLVKSLKPTYVASKRFRSCSLTTDLGRVVYDRIAVPFNRSETTLAVALDKSKTFNRVLHTGLFH